MVISSDVAWDLNHDGTIDFREFTSALGVLIKGTQREKMERTWHWVNCAFDLNFRSCIPDV